MGRIIVSYEDYYPNKLVLEIIANQLRKYNINLIFKEDSYGIWISESHLRLEIRKSLGTTPILLYKSDISRVLLEHDSFEKARYYYTKALCSNNIEEDIIHYLMIDKILLTESIYVPIVIIPRASIFRNNVLKESVFRVGSPVYTVTST